MAVLTVGVYGAPPVFVWQPFLLTNGVHFRILQGVPGLFVTIDGQHVFLVASGSSLENQGERGAGEHYDESYEKINYWKEQQEPEEQRQKKWKKIVIMREEIIGWLQNMKEMKTISKNLMKK
jgi:hypothetical protein